MSQPVQMIDILGWANSEPRIWVWVVAELLSLSALPCRQGELSRTRPPNVIRISSLALMPWNAGRGGWLLTCTHASRVSSTVLPRQGLGPTLLGSAVSYEEMDQLSILTPLEPAHLWVHHQGRCPGKVQGSSSTIVSEEGQN